MSLFHAGARPAPDACFEKVNAAGDIYGNCGKDIYGNYRKCEMRYKAEWQPRAARWKRCFYVLQNYGPGDKTDPCIGSLPPSASWETSCILVGLRVLTAEAFSSPFYCLLRFQTSSCYSPKATKGGIFLISELNVAF